MKIWLLRNKQTSNWQTTKATAAACLRFAVKRQRNCWPITGDSTIKSGGTDLH
jgi:hypothetical protein